MLRCWLLLTTATLPGLTEELCVTDADGVVHISNTKRGLGQSAKHCEPNRRKTKASGPAQPTNRSDYLMLEDEKLSVFSTKVDTNGSVVLPAGVLTGNRGAAQALSKKLLLRESGEENRPFVVVHYGDSHTQGGLMPDEFRRLLSSTPISPGFINKGFPMNWNARINTRGRWRRHNWLRDDTGPFGPLGIAFETDQRGDEIEVDLVDKDFPSEGVRLTVFYSRESPMRPFEMTADGQTLFVGDDAKGDAKQALVPAGMDWVSVNVPPRTRRVTLRTLGDRRRNQRLRIFGFLIRYEASALEYDALGVAGSVAENLLEKGDDAVEQYLAFRQPDLMMFWFGTNELNDPNLTAERYERLFRSFLNRLAKASPSSSCLVVGPPDFSKRDKTCFLTKRQRRALNWRRSKARRNVLKKGLRDRVCEPDRLVNLRKRGRYRFPVPQVRNTVQWRAHKEACQFRTVPNMTAFIEAQRRQAHAAGCLFFDTFQFMGGHGGMHTWACETQPQLGQLDHIHLTGEGYRRVARGIIDALNEAVSSPR